MPADDFVTLVSGPTFLGNPLIKTQHFVGVGKWRKVGEGEISGEHQVRIAHQRYDDESFSKVRLTGHDHGVAVTRFLLVSGEWKFAGLRPVKRWAEGRRSEVFANS